MKIKILWAALLFVSFGVCAEEDLDISILRERIRKAHGEFTMKLTGEWTAALAGNTEAWTWGAQGWICGKKNASCASWTPKSFLMWKGGTFLQTWAPKKRLGFEVQKAKTRAKSPVEGVASESSAEPDEGKKEIDWGQNLVGELWLFANDKNEEIKVLVSSRDQRIDRIESADGVEFLEWIPSRKGKGLELSKIVLERNGTRAMISRKAS